MPKSRKANKTKKNERHADTAVVVVMHGNPPRDFPQGDLREFFMLYGRIESAPSSLSDGQRQRYLELHDKMRCWPRTPENDPFHAAATELGALLRKELTCPIIVGFNEFCAPSVDEAIESAAACDPARILVVTPMLTRGGGHAEEDIPVAIDRARERFPKVHFIYCWPFDSHDIAHFLATQIHRFLNQNST
jgi:sirohydrochlorin cobaltochelatase